MIPFNLSLLKGPPHCHFERKQHLEDVLFAPIYFVIFFSTENLYLFFNSVLGSTSKQCLRLLPAVAPLIVQARDAKSIKSQKFCCRAHHSALAGVTTTFACDGQDGGWKAKQSPLTPVMEI